MNSYKQFPSWMDITEGRMPALPPVTPLPSTRPMCEPLAHRWDIPVPPDQLTDHVQRLIAKYAPDILIVASSGCNCDRCIGCVQSLLFNLISECMTDQNMLLHALKEDRLAVKDLVMTLQTFLPLFLRGRNKQ